MNKMIGVTDLQRNFKAVLDDVTQRKTPYVLTRDSRPEAVVIPYEAWLEFEAARKASLLARFDTMLDERTTQTKSISDKQVDADVKLAMRDVRGTKRSTRVAKKRS